MSSMIVKSGVSGKIPSANTLVYGQLAVNYADEKIYFKNTSNNIVTLFSGPLSSTDNSIPRFDGITGKIVKSSSASIDDGGILTLQGQSTQLICGELDSNTNFIQSKTAAGTGKSLAFFGQFEYGRFDASGNLQVNGQITISGASTNALLKLERTSTSAGHGWLGANSQDALVVLNQQFGGLMTINQLGILSLNGSSTATGWDGSVQAFVFGPSGKGSLSYAGGGTTICDNLYRTTAGFKHTTTGAATYYQTAAGTHWWGTGISGAADTIAQLQNRMTLDILGHLGVGTTPLYRLDVNNGGVQGAKLFRFTGTRSIYGYSDSGGVGISSADPFTSGVLYYQNVLDSSHIFYQGSTACLTVGSTGNILVAGTITESSQITFKENLRPINSALDTVLALTGKIYDRKNGQSYNEPGFIAEEVYKVLPEVVDVDSDGQITGVKYSKLTVYLVEAIKELKTEIATLKEKI